MFSLDFVRHFDFTIKRGDETGGNRGPAIAPGRDLQEEVD